MFLGWNKRCKLSGIFIVLGRNEIQTKQIKLTIETIRDFVLFYTRFAMDGLSTNGSVFVAHSISTKTV